MANKTVIARRFKVGDIAKQMNTTMAKVTQSIVNTMEYVGERCVEIARQKGSYNDITGNLRSSIGYAVIKAGRVVKQSIASPFAGPDGNGEKGAAEAKAFLNKLVGAYPEGVVLVIVAGMDYAVYVEAVHHKDVLTSASLEAEQLVVKLLDQIGIKK